MFLFVRKPASRNPFRFSVEYLTSTTYLLFNDLPISIFLEVRSSPVHPSFILSDCKQVRGPFPVSSGTGPLNNCHWFSGSCCSRRSHPISLLWEPGSNSGYCWQRTEIIWAAREWIRSMYKDFQPSMIESVRPHYVECVQLRPFFRRPDSQVTWGHSPAPVGSVGSTKLSYLTKLS